MSASGILNIYIRQNQSGAISDIERTAIGVRLNTVAVYRDIGHRQSGRPGQSEQACGSRKVVAALDREIAGEDEQVLEFAEIDRDRTVAPGQLAVQHEIRTAAAVKLTLQSGKVKRDRDIPSVSGRNGFPDRIKGIAGHPVVLECIDRQHLFPFDHNCAYRINAAAGDICPVSTALIPGITVRIVVETAAGSCRIVRTGIQCDDARNGVELGSLAGCVLKNQRRGIFVFGGPDQ